MIGHIDSSSVRFRKSKPRYSGAEMMSHDPKWARFCSIVGRFPTCSMLRTAVVAVAEASSSGGEDSQYVEGGRVGERGEGGSRGGWLLRAHHTHSG